MAAAHHEVETARALDAEAGFEWPIDEDDVGTHVGEHHPGEGAGADGLELEDAEAGEGAHRRLQGTRRNAVSVLRAGAMRTPSPAAIPEGMRTKASLFSSMPAGNRADQVCAPLCEST